MHRLGVVGLLEAVDQRPAHERHAAGVLADVRVGVDALDRHVQLQRHPVARVPLAFEAGVAALHQPTKSWLAVDGQARSRHQPGRRSRSANDAGSLQRQLDLHPPVPRIARRLAQRQRLPGDRQPRLALPRRDGPPPRARPCE